MTHKLVRDFLVFFSILDPFTTFAIFIAVTASKTREERNKIAARAIVFAAGVLVAAIAVGQVVLAAIHVSISSFQIAGGLILYGGSAMEIAQGEMGAAGPHHPYTRLLMASVPELRQGWLERGRPHPLR